MALWVADIKLVCVVVLVVLSSIFIGLSVSQVVQQAVFCEQLDDRLLQ